MTVKPCLDCHRLSAGSRCPTCTTARTAQRDAQLADRMEGSRCNRSAGATVRRAR